MKRIVRIVAIGIVLGICLLMIQKGFRIEEDAFMRGYWIVAPLIIAGAVLANVCYNLSYQRKMRKIVGLLDSGNTQEYIEEVEKLLHTAKGQGLRNILKLNLAAGYIEAKRYDTAINMLEELPDQCFLGSALKMCRRLNLCICYFYTAQYEKAMGLYDESQKFLQPYRNGETYGGNIAVLDILAAMKNKQYGQAQTLLEAAQTTWGNPRLQDEFHKLGEMLVEVS